jgi:hypothetical protein
MTKESANTCLCGCGKITPVAPETRPMRGWVRGEQMPYWPHHSKNRWPVSDGVNKRCQKCSRDLPVSEFWTNRRRKDNLQTYCKECSTTGTYNYRNSTDGKVIVARSRLKTALSYYKITAADYNKMLLEQDGLCAICAMPERYKDRNGATIRLSVDHCHATGKVRGLLCGHCNQAIGKFKDDISVLRKAIDYLTAN